MTFPRELLYALNGIFEISYISTCFTAMAEVLVFLLCSYRDWLRSLRLDDLLVSQIEERSLFRYSPLFLTRSFIFSIESYMQCRSKLEESDKRSIVSCEWEVYIFFEAMYLLVHWFLLRLSTIQCLKGLRQLITILIQYQNKASQWTSLFASFLFCFQARAKTTQEQNVFGAILNSNFGKSTFSLVLFPYNRGRIVQVALYSLIIAEMR